MPRVKGPNGLVLTFSDRIAAALVRSGDHELVKDEDKSEAEPKKATPRKRSKK